jgi:hypothetical protein
MVGGWSVRRYFLRTAGGDKVLFGRFDGWWLVGSTVLFEYRWWRKSSIWSVWWLMTQTFAKNVFLAHLAKTSYEFPKKIVCVDFETTTN